LLEIERMSSDQAGPGGAGSDPGGNGSFAERLASARRRQGLKDPSSPGGTGESPDAGAAGPQSNALGVGLRVGVEMVSALVVAVAIGWYLDRWLHTRPVMLALFVLLGGAAGVANVWRLVAPQRPPGKD
jgi:ATP synthase protein I